MFAAWHTLKRIRINDIGWETETQYGTVAHNHLRLDCINCTAHPVQGQQTQWTKNTP